MSDDKRDDFYLKLVNLLKMFKNRPYHLSKYLIDNGALKDEFIDKILNSSKLDDFDEDFQKKFFTDISQMNNYFNQLTDDVKKIVATKSKSELSKELTLKMKSLLSEEKYEEAAVLRDYMFKNGIKKYK